MRLIPKHRWLFLLILPLAIIAAYAATLSTANLTLVTGESAAVGVSNVRGRASLANSNADVVAAVLGKESLSVTALKPGSASLTVRDDRGTSTVAVTVKPPLSVTPASLALAPGQSAALTVSNAIGPIELNSSSGRIATSLAGNIITVRGIEAGVATLTVKDTKTAVAMTITVTATPAVSSTGSTYSLLAWNDLGMHCMDADYSVFSILPPYNNLHAQLVRSDTGSLVTSGVNITYEATADPGGSVNGTSAGKTNFWTYAAALFGIPLESNVGLAGNRMASTTPQPMSFDAGAKMFRAEGIPITPIDDAGNKNTYPVVKVVARDSAGKVLASARAVLPVSDEMTCKGCHATNSYAAAKPSAGWVANENAEREYRLNILRLHDEKAGTRLYDKAVAGTPTLCAACHSTNALGAQGVPGVKSLTESMHARHAQVLDPKSGLRLDDATNRSACYQCHPGSETRCLRGAMSGADIQCQNCHGKMSDVGAAGRVGWLQQPNCQACHYDGKRETSALVSGVLRKPADARFATNPDTPLAGYSLFRMSKGHGSLQCEACHGATHAEYAGTPVDPNLPANHYNDNLLAQDLQGHAGTVGECVVCHKSVPLTTNGGPHGMHTVGQVWVKEHHDRAKGIQSACAYCHGADFRGSPLATVKANRTFSIGDGRTKAYTAGQPVGCYDCHKGPTGG